MNGISIVRKAVLGIIDAERRYAQNLSPELIEIRQTRIREAEFAGRIRSAFPDIETFLNGSGRAADRDVVSDSLSVEVECKYFGGRAAQGGDIPLKDWDWLVGRKMRKPIRDFERITVTIFPTAYEGYGIQRRRRSSTAGRWMFTDCLSFTAGDTVPTCYSQVVELVNPGFGANISQLLEPRLQFRRQFEKRETLIDNGCEIVSEVIGEPFADPFWAMMQVKKA